jgi:zinc transport system substrate-binding protein
MRVSSSAAVLAVLLPLLAACAPAAPPAPRPGVLQVAVSVPPQADFVERIGGRRVQVEVMIPPGASHSTYAPSPRQLVALSRAALYVRVGHPAFLFESEHIDPVLAAHPGTAVVDMSEGMDLILTGEPEGAVEPSGLFGPGGDGEHHHHAAGDPHVWVAPSTVRVAAGNIAAALARLDPAHAGAYRANLRRFVAEIDALDREIRAALGDRRQHQRRFLVYHPAWGYFAREYGLEQVAIEIGGREPSAARLIELIDRARAEQVRVVFQQRGFARKSAEVIAEEIGGRVVVVDPMDRDWAGSLRTASRAFRDALAPAEAFRG